MMILRSDPAGGPTADRPRPRLRPAWRRRPVLTLALALAAVGQAGCSSAGGCNTCGSKLRAFSERVFVQPFRKHFNKGSCCGGAEMGVPVTPVVPYGTPAVVAPAPMGVPSGSGTTIVPNDVGAPSLEPIPQTERRPSATPGPPPGGSGIESIPGAGASTNPATGKANYEAYRPRSRDRSTLATASPATLDATRPEPTPRSAQGLPSSLSSTPGDASPLDNLPPLNLSLDDPRGDPSPPSPSPSPSPSTVPTTVSDPASPDGETLADLAARPPAGDASVAPGLRRYAGLDAKLAGGSLPSAAGLDFLADKGYRTILDLSEDADRSSALIAGAASRGMRYIALPINADHLDAEHVARFQFEINLADARPLYFCDADGSRAAALWFIYQVMFERVDEQFASREAEPIGPRDPRVWRAAEAYVAAHKPAPAPAPAPAPTPRPSVAAPASAPAPRNPKSSAAVGDIETHPRDLASWKPLAALAVAGFGIPLAYIGRSIPGGMVSRARASLPGPRPSPRSLPDASDA